MTKKQEGNASVGRRPLIRNEKIRKDLLEAVTAGNYLETAANYAGISNATLHNWLALGREAKQKELEGETLKGLPRLYAEFLDSVEHAQSRAEVRMVAVVQSEATRDWKAAAWWLERARNKNYGRVEKTELTGAGGGAVKIDTVSERETALKLLADIASRANES